jgi:hypothetical protein
MAVTFLLIWAAFLLLTRSLRPFFPHNEPQETEIKPESESQW